MLEEIILIIVEIVEKDELVFRIVFQGVFNERDFGRLEGPGVVLVCEVVIDGYHVDAIGRLVFISARTHEGI